MARLFVYLIAACLLFLNFLGADSTYKIIDLNPPGSIESYATDINDHGQVVGVYRPQGSKKFVVFLWDRETGYQDLADYDDQYWKRIGAPKINNLGHVVGFESLPGSFFSFWYSVRQPFFWSPETGKKTMHFPKNAKFGGDIEPVSLNDHDQAVIHLMDYYNAPKTGVPMQQWVWHEDQYEIFKKIIPLSLSNQQMMTGVKENIISDIYFPMLYDFQNKSEIFIPFPENMDSGTPLMINDEGDVLLSFVKFEIFSTPKPTYYSWNPIEGLMKLPTDFFPVWINNHGFILGTLSNKQEKEIYLYSGLKMINISQEISNNPFISLDHVLKINEKREIIGSGRFNPNGKARAFLIEPIEKN